MLTDYSVLISESYDGQHIGKKTDHQSKRFRKDSEELDERHHRHRHFQPPRYIGPEKIGRAHV